MRTRSIFNEVYDLEEVDKRVENIWIESNEGTLEPINEWFDSNSKNEVSFISREEASELYNLLKSEFNVDLSVIWNKPTKNYVACLVGIANHIDDIESLRDVLFQSSSTYKVTTDFGNKWFIVEAAYDHDCEICPK